MKSKFRRWIVLAAIVAAVTVAVIIKFQAKQSVRSVSSREEIVAAESLLARKLSGPRYFNAPLAGINEAGGPWIDVSDASSQIERIARERQLGPDATVEVRRLVEQLAEPHPYRMVGGMRINLPRLNLSLDSIK